MEKNYLYKRRNKAMRAGLEDKVFYAVTYTALTLFLLVVLYPLIFVVSASFSSAEAVSTGKVVLLPVDLSLDGYKAVFAYKDIWIGYRNTIFYTVVGTLINVIVTMMAAYPLSRKDLPGRNIFMFLFAFTMMFTGGLVPYYILVRDLNMIDKVWALLIPGAMSVYNMILTRTNIQSNIPNELLEASRMDGCSDITYLTHIVLPLSKAVIAVITLFYAVGHWNAYFEAFLFLNKRELFPLQLVLREVLVANGIVDNSIFDDPDLAAQKQVFADLLKYALIMVSTVPMFMFYPFIQKYFVKGVMIGSLKG